MEPKVTNKVYSVTKFTALKLKLLRTSKPVINLSLLSKQQKPSRNLRITLKRRFWTKEGYEGLADLLNAIIEEFGELSIFDFRAFTQEDPSISLRLFSLSQATQLCQRAEEWEQLHSCIFLEEISCFEYSDKVLFVSQKGFDLPTVYNFFQVYGKVHRFEKVSMKKILVQFDDDRATQRILDQINNKRAEGAGATLSLLNELIQGTGDSFLLDCCFPFKAGFKKVIFFDNTNPFKLRDQSGFKPRREKENVGRYGLQGRLMGFGARAPLNTNFGNERAVGMEGSKGLGCSVPSSSRFDSFKLSLFTGGGDSGEAGLGDFGKSDGGKRVPLTRQFENRGWLKDLVPSAKKNGKKKAYRQPISLLGTSACKESAEAQVAQEKQKPDQTK